MFRPDLTPAQHVARREALAQIGRGADLGRGTQAIDDQIIQPLGKRFLDGHRLDAAGLAQAMAKARYIISHFGPAIMDEASRPPTRTRPKGEEHEITSLSRVIGDPKRGQTGYELLGISLSLSRRRLSYSFDGTGIFLTKHLLERTIERGLASWTGKLAEVEDAVLGSLGLASVWRRALEAGATADRRIALPCGSGLIYGIMESQPYKRTSVSFSVTGTRIDRDTNPNLFLTHPAIAETASTDIVLRTAVDEDSLTIEQCDLRDELLRFSTRHEAALADVMRGVLWRRSTLTPVRPYDVTAPEMDAIAAELIRLLRSPDAQEALRGRKPEPAGSEAPERMRDTPYGHRR